MINTKQYMQDSEDADLIDDLLNPNIDEESDEEDDDDDAEAEGLN